MKIKGSKLFTVGTQEAIGKVMSAKWNFTKEERKKCIAFSKAIMEAGSAFEEYRKKVTNDHTPIETSTLELKDIQKIKDAIEADMNSYLEEEIELPDFDFHYENVKDFDHFTSGELANLSNIGVYRE